VLEARNLLDAVRAAQKQASDEQYAASLAAWASALAQSKQGFDEVDEEVPDPDKPGKTKIVKKKVTKLTKRDSSAGVLHITIEGGEPDTPVRVLKVTLTGLPEPALRRLEKRGTIGALNLPRQVEGTVKGGIKNGRPLDGKIFITKNEANVVRNISNNPDGTAWLAQKGEREAVVEDFAHAGAQATWFEVDGHELSANELKS
jgi:hypothetical protein